MSRKSPETPDREGAQGALIRALVAAPGESGWEDVAERVARAVAEAEPERDRPAWRDRFARWIRERRFLPNLPTLANAGRGGQLAACFVLEPSDALRSIYDALSRAALIQQGSGGIGIHFSNLRPRGAAIRRSGGVAPGPVGFLELFAHSARVNSRVGRRPGAHLAVLRDDHPDVVEFVRAKRERPGALAGVGLAVSLRDALFAAADAGEPVTLVDARGKRVGRIGAEGLLREVAGAIHETGEPSLLFADTLERANPCPELGPLRATNPCGEQPLLPDESCVLGSLHLPAFADGGGELDRERLAGAVGDAVRFLDDVLEVNRHPDAEIAEATRRTRKIGLGVMGLADLLLLRGQPYSVDGALWLVHDVLALVSERARAASEALAAERGAFPAQRSGPPVRNATRLAVAPTGTLRLLAGCSGGIEPFLRPVLRIGEADRGFLWVDRWLEAWVGKHAEVPLQALEALRVERPTGELPGLGPAQARLLRRGWEIDASEQIQLHAACQSHVDGAVSKTVHLPEDASPREILWLIRMAHRVGCKGISFFRRGCAAAHPVGEEAVDVALAAPARDPRRLA